MKVFLVSILSMMSNRRDNDFNQCDLMIGQCKAVRFT
jgi:hypothetical protein